MANLIGTKTEKNLEEALAGESLARNKYTYFAAIAEKDGYEHIASFFEEVANNEKEHARVWFKLLCGGVMPGTADNLKAAIEGENKEWSEMYKRMAAEAREEGFDDIAFLFDSVGDIEKEHEERYSKLLDSIEDNTVIERKEKSKWVCRICGYSTGSERAPEKCPVCEHPKEYFDLKQDN